MNLLSFHLCRPTNGTPPARRDISRSFFIHGTRGASALRAIFFFFIFSRFMIMTKWKYTHQLHAREFN